MPALTLREQSSACRCRSPLRVALVDPDPAVCSLLRNTLAPLDQPCLLDIFPTLESTRRLWTTPVAYHLVLLAIDMPDLAPALFIRKLRALSHDVRIVALARDNFSRSFSSSPPLTEPANGALVFSTLASGATALLVKPLEQQRLLRAIDATDHHQPFVDEPALKAMLAFVHESAPAASFPALTSRETEILSCLGQHLCDKDIGRRLHIETATVNAHLKKLYRKLHIHDRGRAAQQYLRAGGAR